MKKNGRLVAIALGSVLCASCVGGAFLVAGSTPAAETVRAADAETLTCSYTPSNDDSSKFKTSGPIELNGATWNWGTAQEYCAMATNADRPALQIGSKKAPFTGGILSIDSSLLFGSEYAVTSVKIGLASYSSSTKAIIKVDSETYEGTIIKWSTDYEILNFNLSVPTEGLISFEFPESERAFYLGEIEIVAEKSHLDPASYDHIGFAGELNKTEYFVGDAFTLDGVSIYAYPTAEDVDGVDVTDEAEFMADPEVFSEPGEGVEVYVCALFGELEAEMTFSVNVNPEITAESLTVSGLEEDKVYSVGDIVDFSLVKITAHMSDGSDYDATYDLALDPYTITLEDAANGSVEFPLEFKGATSSIVISTGLSDILSARSAASGSKVATKGLVTGKFWHTNGYSLFVEDGGAAVLAYNIDKSLSENVEVGDMIAISGSITDFSGVMEVEKVTDLKVISKGNAVEPTEIEDVSASALDGWDSRYITISGLTFKSGSLANSSGKRANLTLEHESGEVVFRALTDAAAKTLQSGLDEFLEKIDNLPFAFTGHIGWYYENPQFAPTSIDEFFCPDYDAVMAFINKYMQPDVSPSDEGDGKSCLEWYPAAKAALEALTETQRNFFLTSDATAAYAKRYNNWAKAYGEGATSSLGTIMSSNDTAAIIALVALSSATVAAAGFMIASRRRKAK